jgi:hypothetical protein
MTALEQAPVPAFETVTFDLYRDIHKGIRSELFGVTLSAGNTNPADCAARTELASRVGRLADLLESHAAHEDRVVQPAIERYLPDVAEVIEHDHASFAVRVSDLVAIAATVADVSGPAARTRLHQLYLGMASFTSVYLAHQDIEERVVMPMLEREIGVEAVIAMHGAIVGAIPPDEMARTQALMFPAMNVDDRTDVLGGIQHTAPAEVFAGVWSLAGSVVPAAEHAQVGARLGVA